MVEGNNNGVPPEKYFYVCDGAVLRSIEDLFEYLQEMPENVFRHHVNEHRNDFHNWVRDVFQDHELALNLKNCSDKDEMLKHVFVGLFR